ncbi:MAG TPA: hypothetical protein VGL81_06725 [Polyangiaceae bacterium]|jgi:hypothetical protein
MPLTDFFLASVEELRAACRGWKEPLATPVIRRGTNPFTKKPIEIRTTAPDPGEPFPADAVLHVDLSRLHRVDLKGLGTVEMEHLMRTTLGAADEDVRALYDPPLWGPPATDETVLRVPPALVQHLARMSETELAACGDRWTAAVRGGMDAHGLERFARDLRRDYLFPLSELARRAVAENRQMFMWMAP